MIYVCERENMINPWCQAVLVNVASRQSPAGESLQCCSVARR